jgi:hypothetical protein
MEFTLTKKGKAPKEAGKVKKVAAVDPNSLVQLSTNFDYLNGAFGRAEKGRKTTTIVVLTGLLLSAGLGMLGFQAKTAAGDDVTAKAAADSANTATLAELAQVDQAGGIPADLLRTQTAARFGAYKKIVTGETDLRGLIRATNDSAPSGVSVTALAVVEPEATPPAGADGAEAAPAAPAAPAPAAPADGTKPAPAAGVKTITITGLASSFAKIGEWQAALTRIPGLANIEPSWSGGGAELTVTITATLEQGTWSKRAVEAQKADANGLPLPAAGAPATTEGQ